MQLRNRTSVALVKEKWQPRCRRREFEAEVRSNRKPLQTTPWTPLVNCDLDARGPNPRATNRIDDVFIFIDLRTFGRRQ